MENTYTKYQKAIQMLDCTFDSKREMTIELAEFGFTKNLKKRLLEYLDKEIIWTKDKITGLKDQTVPIKND